MEGRMSDGSTIEEPVMTRLQIPDMSCGHCVAAIESAVRRIDPQARIWADLQARAVTVDTRVAAEDLQDAVGAAGYENSLTDEAG